MSRSKEIDRQEALPDCPKCGHNVLTHRCKRQYNDWVCEGCGGRWCTGETRVRYTGRGPGGAES